ncbi:MAG: efflux RND transporter periplasmic adaptor subunit [Clostridia bacterium]|nr:efflux RND transporter periplasmic adaptor subunit [Clostridia bacterium]
MKKKKLFVFLIIFVVIVVAFFMFNSHKGQTLPNIKTTKVETGDIQTLLSTNALVQSKEVKNYMGSPQMTVDKVNVEVGDKVKKGDVLLTYDVTDLNTAVKQAQIQYDNALLNKKELLKQKDDIEKQIIDLDEQIYALDGNTNPQDVATVQSLIQKRKSIQTISDEKIELMDNSIALAKLSLDSAQERLNKVKDGIVADIDGTVTASNAIEDSTLSMAQPAFVVQQLDNLKGVINLGKYDAAKIRLGQKVTLKNGVNTYEGVVSFIKPSASKEMAAQDATLQAEIDIKNPDDQLKVDFDIDADILTGEVTNVLKLPIECFKFDRNDQASVFIIEGGKAKLVNVKLGLQSDTEAQIKEGLKEGDTVIVNPGMDIKDGTVVLPEGAKK